MIGFDLEGNVIGGPGSLGDDTEFSGVGYNPKNPRKAATHEDLYPGRKAAMKAKGLIFGTKAYRDWNAKTRNLMGVTEDQKFSSADWINKFGGMTPSQINDAAEAATDKLGSVTTLSSPVKPNMKQFYLDDLTASFSLSPYEVAKTDIEHKKQAGVTMPSDWIAQNLFEDTTGQTAGLNIASGPATVKPNFVGRWGPMSPHRDRMFDRRNWGRGPYRHASMGGGPQWMNEQAAASVPLGPYTRAPMGNVAGDPSSYQYTPMTFDQRNLAQQQELFDNLDDWAKNWDSLSDIVKQINPLYQNLSSDESIASKLGLGDEQVGRRISSRAQLEAMRRLEPRKHQFTARLEQVQEQLRPLREEQDRLISQRLINPDKKAVFDYAANPRMTGKITDYWGQQQWDPPGSEGWDYIRHNQERYDELSRQIAPLREEITRLENAPNTFYDLMRHGFLNEEVSLPVSQMIELLDSGGQPSDFYNNMLASKFMRGNPAGTGLISSALVARLLDKSPYSAPAFDKQQHDRLTAILAQAGITPSSPSARISSSMDAWDKLVFHEIMNPGSTGYDFNTNVMDEGLWRNEQGDPRSVMEMINFLRSADWTGEKARQMLEEEGGS
jgi:hypothetical protein